AGDLSVGVGIGTGRSNRLRIWLRRGREIGNSQLAAATGAAAESPGSCTRGADFHTATASQYSDIHQNSSRDGRRIVACYGNCLADRSNDNCRWDWCRVQAAFRWPGRSELVELGKLI